MARPRVPIADRFWKFVDASDIGGCWTWTGETTRGYGRFWIGKRRIGAHRVAWELERGPIPVGYTIDHLCRNPSCVRVDHLEPVPNKVNLERGVPNPPRLNKSKTHCAKGHELTAENVRLDRGGTKRTCRTCERAKHARLYAEGKRYTPSPRGPKHRARGSAANKSSLTERDVKEIRDLDTVMSRTEIAGHYGVTRQNVRLIVLRKIWTDV